MDINLWISIGLAVPLAIFANLLTPKVQVFLDRYQNKKGKEKLSKQIAEKKLKINELKKEFRLVTEIRSESSALVSFYFMEVFRIASLAAAAIMLGGLVYLVENATWEKKLFDYTIQWIAQITFFIIIYSIYLRGRVAYQFASKIMHYEEYSSKTTELIESHSDSIDESNENHT